MSSCLNFLVYFLVIMRGEKFEMGGDMSGIVHKCMEFQHNQEDENYERLREVYCDVKVHHNGLDHVFVKVPSEHLQVVPPFNGQFNIHDLDSVLRQAERIFESNPNLEQKPYDERLYGYACNDTDHLHITIGKDSKTTYSQDPQVEVYVLPESGKQHPYLDHRCITIDGR